MNKIHHYFNDIFYDYKCFNRLIGSDDNCYQFCKFHYIFGIRLLEDNRYRLRVFNTKLFDLEGNYRVQEQFLSYDIEEIKKTILKYVDRKKVKSE